MNERSNLEHKQTKMASDLLLTNERETILDYVYNSFTTEVELGLQSHQLQQIYQDLRSVSLNLSQIKASIHHVCSCPPLCDREELLDVLKEMDRRYYLAQDLQWEFAMLDRQRKSAITKADAMFLFKMVYGEFFSKFKFENLMNSRKVVDSDVSFEELEVELCNIPTYEWIDELLHEEEKENEEKEFLSKEKERKRKESLEAKRCEEDMKMKMEEEDQKFQEMLQKKKIEKVENEKNQIEQEAKEMIEKEKREKEEEERRKKQKGEEQRKAVEEAERERLAAEEALLKSEKAEKERLEAEKAEEERLAAEKAEQERLEAESAKQSQLDVEKAEQEKQKTDQERLEAEKAEQTRLDAEKAEQERLDVEKADQERLDAEKADQEKLDAEKAEQERLESEKAEADEIVAEPKKKPDVEIKEIESKEIERAVENWGKAKTVAKEKVRKERVKKMYTIKARYDEEEASKQSLNAEQALEAEKKAEIEFEKAEQELAQASTEEDKEKAKKARKKAKKSALKYKERRLRSTLKAAVKLRSKPRIDASLEEAKEALPEIPTLKPDVEVAEKVSDSIQCGNELEEAMAKRDLQGIESSVETIKKKGYTNDHAVQLLEADKLAHKLRRLEKLKKDIMALDQRTISEIRSYKKPLPAIHDVMIATYIILGYKEKELKEWKYILGLLGRTGKEGLKRQCTTIDATTIVVNAASLADKKYLSKHDLETVTDISAGAATFFVWSTAMIEENRSWHEDSEFREKLQEKKKKEEEEARKLEEEKKSKKPTAAPKQRKKSNTAANPAVADKKKEKLAKPPGSPATSRSRSRSPATQRKNLKAGEDKKSRSKSPSKKK